MNRSIIFAAIIISAAILLNGFLERRGLSVPTTAAPARQAPVRPRDQTVAVLPFKNLNSGDPDNALADGIQREIITRLAAQHVKVSGAPEATGSGASSSADLRELAARFGATNALFGSVQRAGNHVRVSVQLVDAVSGTHLWAESYDRELTDVLALEREIAEKVASAVAKRKT